MNTAELEQYMLNDPYIRHFYGGVLGRNELPLYMKKTKIYIVNTDPIDEPGTHWTAFYVDRIAEYFDSIASIPEQDFKHFNFKRFAI